MRASQIIVVILIVMMLGFGAVGAYFIYKTTQVVKLLPWLSEELSGKPVLTMGTLSIEPGQVFMVTGDKQGWQIVEKDSKLYEHLVLDNIDLRPNDVIAPHLWDVYLDGDYDSIVVSDVDLLHFSSPMSIAVRLKFVADAPARENTIVWMEREYILSSTVKTTGSVGIAIKCWNGSTWEQYPLATSDVYNIDTWYDILAIYDGGKKIYVDGTLVAERSEMENITQSTGPFYIAKYTYRPFKGKISYVIKFDADISQYLQQLTNNIIIVKPKFLMDPTFYNGSDYIDIVNSIVGEPYGGVIRIPAEETWLWLIQSLKSDNKLHFMWFPEGSIIQIKDQNGNVIKKFTVDGDPINEDSQIEDYTISLDTDVLPQVTVEAWIPAFKVRVYAPYGSTVQIVDESGVIIGEAKVNSNYVDIPISKPINGQIIILAQDIAEEELDVLTELNSSILTVKVLDNGNPVPGVLVRVADPAGVVIFADTTDQSGTVQYEIDRPLPEATIEVSGIWKYKLVYQSTTIQLSANVTTSNVNNTEQLKLILIGFVVIVMIATVIIFSTRGIKVRV